MLSDSGAADRPWALAVAHVALVARRRGWPVVTTAPDLLLRVVPELEIELLP